MVPERKRVEHVDDVHGIVFVLLAEVLQYADLLLRLAVEPLLVADHLESDVLAFLVVVRLDDLTETTLADHLEHLVPVRYVIVGYVYVRALLIVVVAIVRKPDEPGTFLGVRAYEVHLGVIEYFTVFVGGKFAHVELHDLLGASGRSGRPLVGRLRVVGRLRRGRAGLERWQRPVPEQHAPEPSSAHQSPYRYVAGHGRAAAATSAHLARRGRVDPRALAHTTAPHCTCTRRRRHSGTLHDISHRPGGARPTLPLMRAHSVSETIR